MIQKLLRELHQEHSDKHDKIINMQQLFQVYKVDIINFMALLGVNMPDYEELFNKTLDVQSQKGKRL